MTNQSIADLAPTADDTPSILRRLLGNSAIAIGAIIIAAIVLAAALAEVIAPYDPLRQSPGTPQAAALGWLPARNR